MRATFFCVFFILAACDSTYDDQYRLQGAGVPLHTGLTDRNTENLTKYLAALCLQAGFENPECAPSPGSNASGNWNLLVQTGYNDIDYRCDAYLNWIDSKRSERILFEGTTNAIGTLAAGILKGSSTSADTLANIALALGFVREVYGSYQSSILLGLEGSTIKEIVNKRRMAHRQQFRAATYNNRPEAIFALRRYLTYCTPQSILTDVNTFSRGAASGNLPTIQGDANAAAEVIGSFSQATPQQRNPDVLPERPEIALFKPFGSTEVRRIQRAACLTPDGDPGPATVRAIALMHDSRQGMDDETNTLSFDEWTAHSETLRPCDTLQYKNLFENVDLGADLGKSTIAALTQNSNFSSDLSGKTLNATEVRAEIAINRKRLGLAEPAYGISTDSDQLTPELVKRLLRGD